MNSIVGRSEQMQVTTLSRDAFRRLVQVCLSCRRPTTRFVRRLDFLCKCVFFVLLVISCGGTNAQDKNVVESVSRDWGAVYKKVRPSIVRVDVDSTNYGSGTIISSEGHVLVHSLHGENFIQNTHSLFVTISDGRRLRAIPLGWSSEWCIGLIKIDGTENFSFVPLSAKAAAPGAPCPTIGFKADYRSFKPGAASEPTMILGNVESAFRGQWLKGSHPSGSDMLGSCLLNAEGEMQGMYIGNGLFTSSRAISSLWRDLALKETNLDIKRLHRSFDLAMLLPSAQMGKPSEPREAAIRIRNKSNRQSAWSGVVISPEGLIATCAHTNIGPGDGVIIEFEDGRNLEATMLGMNKLTDIALVKVNADQVAEPLPFVRIGESAKLGVGTTCRMYGFPADYSKRKPVEEQGRFAPGLYEERMDDKNVYSRFESQPHGGQSGSGLFNANHELIGIFTGWFGDTRMATRIEALLAQWKELLDPSGYDRSDK